MKEIVVCSMFQRADGWCESATERYNRHSRTAKLKTLSRLRRCLLLVSATVILLGLLDLMRCSSHFIDAAKKGGTARFISCPLIYLIKEVRDFLFSEIQAKHFK